MPELPEVETLRRELQAANLSNLAIFSVNVYWSGCLEGVAPELFCHALKGISIRSFSRRAKYLVWELSNGKFLHLHLRMTGRVTVKTANEPRLVHEHLVIQFSDERELRFHDTRKFGRITLVDSLEGLESKLGPEPLADTWSKARLRQDLKGVSRQLKSLLLDQSFIAGLGNIYVDEALWEAGLHPLRNSRTLEPVEMDRLFDAIRLVLQRGLVRGGTTLGYGTNNFYRLEGQRGEHQLELRVFRKTGEPCPRCGTAIERIVVAQRSTHFCPSCQK